MRNKHFLALLGLTVAMANPARAASITENPLPQPFSRPTSITAGPDGNLWFMEEGLDKIARLTTGGALTEFPVPSAGSPYPSITVGPDGNLWFTEQGTSKIGRVTPLGVVTEFSTGVGSQPNFITTGPNSSLYYTSLDGSVRKITTSGSVTTLQGYYYAGGLRGIVARPDGTLWVANQNTNTIDKLSDIDNLTAITVTSYGIPSATSSPQAITVGPDGNIWFTEQIGKIGRLNVGTGVITEFTIPTPDSIPGSITAGPDGNIWFTENNTHKIGRITPAGVINEIPIPTAGGRPVGIAAGSDGNIWFTEFSGNNIGTVVPGEFPACTVPAITISNTPWKKISPVAGTTVAWVHAHISKPKGIPANAVSSASFTGGRLTVNSVSYNLPDGLMIFDPNATAPSTTFNTSLNRWETTVNPSDQSNEQFFGGAAIPITANLAEEGKASVSYDLSSSQQGLSIDWQWGVAAYNYWPTSWSAALISPTHTTERAGVPLNPTVRQSLVGGGSDYSGGTSSTGHAACASK